MEGVGTSSEMSEGTIPWKESVDSVRNKLSRIMQDDCMDGIGRVESGTETEQLSRSTPGTKVEGGINNNIILIFFESSCLRGK
jgi:hypothetical protein